MTKLIGVFIVMVFLFVGWKIYLYYDDIQNEADLKKKQQDAELNIPPESLQGVPYQLQSSLDKAYKRGGVGLGEWLKAYGTQAQDPRKAWIELDYCVALSQSNPAEAKRIFNDVKQRTPTNSIVVYRRVKQLEKTYQ
jgi:hypothetical protein